MRTSRIGNPRPSPATKRIFGPLDAALAKKGGKSVFKQPLHRTASGLVIDLTPDEEAEMLRLMRDRGELRLGEPLKPLGGSEAFKAANSARVVLDWLARQGYINYERISR